MQIAGYIHYLLSSADRTRLHRRTVYLVSSAGFMPACIFFIVRVSSRFFLVCSNNYQSGKRGAPRRDSLPRPFLVAVNAASARVVCSGVSLPLLLEANLR